MGASSHERKIKSTHRLQHRRHRRRSRARPISPSCRLADQMAVRPPCSSERNQFRYHLALSTLYPPRALLLAPAREPTSLSLSPSLVARLIKCEIPLSSFAFVNSSSSAGALAFLILGALFFRSSYSADGRVVSTFAPSPVAHISPYSYPFLWSCSCARAREYTAAAAVDIARRYRGVKGVWIFV